MTAEKPIVMCLGPAGTNSHEAAAAYVGYRFAHDPEPTFFASVAEALREAYLRPSGGREALAVAPIENSSTGLIEDTRLFWLNLLGNGQPDIRVVGEVILPVSHCLAVRPDSLGVPPVSVYSHEQALAQCAGHVREAGLTPVCVASTAAAARDLAALPGPSDRAVICSRFAVRRYGLSVLASGFEDQPGNATRFHVVARASCPPEPTGADRMAVLVELENRPGALHYATGMFAAHGANLSTQKDVPLGPGRYAHYFEAECHEGERQGANVLACLRTLAVEGRMLVLGSYQQAPRAPMEGGGR